MNEAWKIHHGDCIPHMATEMEPQSVDMAVFSPPQLADIKSIQPQNMAFA